MNLKQVVTSIFVIACIVIFPHLGLIPFFGYSIPILVLVWLQLKLTKESFSDIGFNFKSFELKSIPIGIIAAMCILSFMQLIFFPTLELFVTLDAENLGLYDFLKESPIQLVFLIIMGWLVGGLYEEIVFHGYIFTRLEKMFKGKYATQISFIITAFLFGIYHIQMGAAGWINALIVGCVYLGIFLYFKRNLWYSIMCHGAYNTLVMTLIYNGYL